VTGRGLVSGAALLAALLICTAAPLQAQDMAKQAAQSALMVTAGAGGVVAGSDDGTDRDAGWTLLGGVELQQPRWTGFASRLALRIEGGFMSQRLSSATDIMSGDVQTVHGAGLVSVTFLKHQQFEPYVLAGPVLARSSTKLVLDAPTDQTPGAGFEQITHETAAGALLGIGTGWRAGSALVRLEARWLTLATTKSTTMVPLILSIAVPLHH
jgi:hypothetical protein